MCSASLKFKLYKNVLTSVKGMQATYVLVQLINEMCVYNLKDKIAMGYESSFNYLNEWYSFCL